MWIAVVDCWTVDVVQYSQAYGPFSTDAEADAWVEKKGFRETELHLREIIPLVSNTMKYVIGQKLLTDYYVPVVFPDEVTHSSIADVLKKSQCLVVSAGFVFFKDGKWAVSDKNSESLKLGPAHWDQVILNLFLTQGLTGLDLCNMMSFATELLEEMLKYE